MKLQDEEKNDERDRNILMLTDYHDYGRVVRDIYVWRERMGVNGDIHI